MRVMEMADYRVVGDLRHDFLEAYGRCLVALPGYRRARHLSGVVAVAKVSRSKLTLERRRRISPSPMRPGRFSHRTLPPRVLKTKTEDART